MISKCNHLQLLLTILRKMKTRWKAQPDCSPWRKNFKNCCGQTLILIPDEANKSLKPKDYLCCCLLNLSGLSTYLSFADRHLWIFRQYKISRIFKICPKPGLPLLPPIKCNSYLFFKRDFSSWVHMLNATEKSKAAVVFYSKHFKHLGSYKGLIFRWVMC